MLFFKTSIILAMITAGMVHAQNQGTGCDYPALAAGAKYGYCNYATGSLPCTKDHPCVNHNKPCDLHPEHNSATCY
ncbi:unnamed protein product [Zymoseptoria tritici ST99CH_3D7]|uniref:Endo-1,3(4)-beta-glucanase 1 carbohydrate binding domain-containing protein n=1 Tax=Zymoseptoria tritici (strain ST99CH_3D7) TaxID=1276538 RepID=A0A1X7RT32_ZYMT9|nr:unnamed protein product [Zymoseptoria tritici ST99CH_3D7]